VGATVGAENVAIHIQTSADDSALTDTGASVNALSQATVAATKEMAAATNQAAQSEQNLTNVFASASTATAAEIALRERLGQLLAENGNNLQQAAAVLAQEQEAAAQATQTTEQHANALEQETAAATQATSAIEQTTNAEKLQSVADQELTATTEAVIAATEAKAAATAEANGQMAKIPAQARTAANSLSVLTQAAVAGKGGISGISNAAGGLAFGLAALVPEFALVSYGIGAVVTVGTLLYEVWDKEAEKREKLNQAIAKGLAQDPALEAYIKAQATASEMSAQMAEETQAAIDRATLSQDNAARQSVIRAEQRQEDEIRALKITEGEKTALIIQAQRDRDAQLDEITARRQRQDEQRARALDATIQEETQSAIDARTLTEEQAAEQRVVREERRREEEIRALQISEDEKTQLILAAQADRDAQLAEIAKRAADKRAEEERRDADRAAEEFRRIILSGVDAAISSSDSYVKAVTRALLTPIVNYLESVAESQIVDAAADLAFGNFVGAAQHAGVAALAIAGARKVASIGGLNSAGGGGSATTGGSGYSGGPTFTPSAPAQGATNVTIQFVKPTTGEVINEVSYYLQRNATLNKPIYVPATAGGLS
jgi:hypothetical protein